MMLQKFVEFLLEVLEYKTEEIDVSESLGRALRVLRLLANYFKTDVMMAGQLCPDKR